MRSWTRLNAKQIKKSRDVDITKLEMLKSLNDQIFKSLKHSDEAKTPNSETQIAKKMHKFKTETTNQFSH